MCLRLADECQDCLVRLQARDSTQTGNWSRQCMWYALLFHRLIETIPPGVVAGVRWLIQCCMDEEDPVDCRVAWLPHTHHLFPDPFKVSAACLIAGC